MKILALLLLLASPLAAQTIVTQPVAQSVAVGQPATFTLAISDPTCSVFWQRNGSNILNGLDFLSYTTPPATLADNGAKFGAVVYNCKTAANAHSATATLTVTASTLASLAISPITPTVGVGQTSAMTLTGTYSDASTKNLTSSAVWVSGTPTVASIAAGGAIFGVTQGTSAITGTVGGMNVSTLVTVEPVLQVTFTPSNEDGTAPPATLVVAQVIANADGVSFTYQPVLQLPDPITNDSALPLMYNPAGLYQVTFLNNQVPVGGPLNFSPALLLSVMPAIKGMSFSVVLCVTTCPVGAVKSMNWGAQ
jgi:hypothetical protein